MGSAQPTREEVEANVARLKKQQIQDQAKDGKHDLTVVEQLRLENSRLKLEALSVQKMALENEMRAAMADILERLKLPDDTQLMVDSSTKPWTVRVVPTEEG